MTMQATTPAKPWEAHFLSQVEAKRGLILEIGRRHGARTMGVFGSVVRGDDGPESDVDFLVELEPGRSLFDLGGLQADLASALGRAVDVVTPNGLRHRIRDEVMREVRPL